MKESIADHNHGSPTDLTFFFQAPCQHIMHAPKIKHTHTHGIHPRDSRMYYTAEQILQMFFKMITFKLCVEMVAWQEVLPSAGTHNSFVCCLLPKCLVCCCCFFSFSLLR